MLSSELKSQYTVRTDTLVAIMIASTVGALALVLDLVLDLNLWSDPRAPWWGQ